MCTIGICLTCAHFATGCSQPLAHPMWVSYPGYLMHMTTFNDIMLSSHINNDRASMAKTTMDVGDAITGQET